jgi:CRP-like cAMP-binding protein
MFSEFRRFICRSKGGHELLVDLVNGPTLDAFVHQDYQSDEVVLSREIATDRLFIVLQGRLCDPKCRRVYSRGSLLQPVDFFAADQYQDLIVAKSNCRVLVMTRDEVRELLSAKSAMTWFFARTLSIERLAARAFGSQS